MGLLSSPTTSVHVMWYITMYICIRCIMCVHAMHVMYIIRITGRHSYSSMNINGLGASGKHAVQCGACRGGGGRESRTAHSIPKPDPPPINLLRYPTLEVLMRTAAQRPPHTLHM